MRLKEHKLPNITGYDHKVIRTKPIIAFSTVLYSLVPRPFKRRRKGLVHTARACAGCTWLHSDQSRYHSDHSRVLNDVQFYGR